MVGGFSKYLSHQIDMFFFFFNYNWYPLLGFGFVCANRGFHSSMILISLGDKGESCVPTSLVKTWILQEKLVHFSFILKKNTSYQIKQQRATQKIRTTFLSIMESSSHKHAHNLLFNIFIYENYSHAYNNNWIARKAIPSNPHAQKLSWIIFVCLQQMNLFIIPRDPSHRTGTHKNIFGSKSLTLDL